LHEVIDPGEYRRMIRCVPDIIDPGEYRPMIRLHFALQAAATR